NVSATPSTSARATAATFDERLNIAKGMCALAMWMRVCRLFWPTIIRQRIKARSRRAVTQGISPKDCRLCNWEVQLPRPPGGCVRWHCRSPADQAADGIGGSISNLSPQTVRRNFTQASAREAGLMTRFQHTQQQQTRCRRWTALGQLRPRRVGELSAVPRDQTCYQRIGLWLK